MNAPRVVTWMDRLAHDLRGPLAPMLTAIYLLRESGADGRQRHDLLEMMERQIQRLGGMIDEVSDISRAEKGRLVGRTESIDVDLLLDDIVARMRTVAPEITFEPGARGQRIEGDILRIGQLLMTLLGLQFSRQHPVPVRARLARTGDGLRMSCAVHCRDATLLPVAALLSMPHPEPQDDSLGLGLMIAAAIAQAHGGRLQGEATAGDTIELVLDLPLQPAATLSPDAPATAGDPP